MCIHYFNMKPITHLTRTAWMTYNLCREVRWNLPKVKWWSESFLSAMVKCQYHSICFCSRIYGIIMHRDKSSHPYYSLYNTQSSRLNTTVLRLNSPFIIIIQIRMKLPLDLLIYDIKHVDSVQLWQTESTASTGCLSFEPRKHTSLSCWHREYIYLMRRGLQSLLLY